METTEWTGRYEDLLVRKNAQSLSRELRFDDSPEMGRRRRLTALSLTSIGAMGLITLYQMGLIDHLPEPDLPYMDADKVDAAGEAYEKLSMPDAAVGLASYAVTLGLTTMGGPDRARRYPWIPMALAGKVAVDALQAGRLSVRQWTEHRAFCFWCLTAAAATFAAVPQVIPEARQAWRTLRGAEA